MEANGVNYYKGVLLCSRPNQSPSVDREKPFCGRVVPPDQLGLVPTKQYNEHRTRPRKLPVLDNHKKWLQKFKKQVIENKQKKQHEEQKKQQMMEKIRQQGRQRLKETLSASYSPPKQKYTVQVTKSPQKQKSKSVAPVNPHKKKGKPAWAQTENEAEQNQEHQVDELLDFFQKGDTQQVKDYVSNESIRKVLKDLKEKIEALKNEGSQWKDKKMNVINQEKDEDSKNQAQPEKDDILSRISRNSGNQSVTSQKTAERVEQLQKKKAAQKEWDKQSTNSKAASVDEQIAKHVADQILRNYPNLKHHSNQSIRKLLQKQAREQIKTE